jgi:hypothetical protein
MTHDPPAVRLAGTRLPGRRPRHSYGEPVARYVIDAPTLLRLADAGLHVHPGHQLVAPNSIRSEAVTKLQADALVTADPGLAAAARNIVPVAAIEDLLAPG